MKGATLEVIGIEKGNGTTLTREHNMTAVEKNPVSCTVKPLLKTTLFTDHLIFKITSLF